MVVQRRGVALRHEPRLDDPDWIRDNGAARTSDYGGPEINDVSVS